MQGHKRHDGITWGYRAGGHCRIRDFIAGDRPLIASRAESAAGRLFTTSAEKTGMAAVFVEGLAGLRGEHGFFFPFSLP
jgi:hypothetical protein